MPIHRVAIRLAVKKKLVTDPTEGKGRNGPFMILMGGVGAGCHQKRNGKWVNAWSYYPIKCEDEKKEKRTTKEIDPEDQNKDETEFRNGSEGEDGQESRNDIREGSERCGVKVRGDSNH